MKFRCLSLMLVAAMFAFSCEEINPDAKNNQEQSGENADPNDPNNPKDPNGQDDPNNPNGQNDPNNPNGGRDGNVVWNQDDQKQFLEDVGKEVLALGGLDDWRAVAKDFVAFGSAIGESDSKSIAEVFSDAGLVGTKEYGSDPYISRGYPMGSVSYQQGYDNFKELGDSFVQPDKVKGHFTLSGDGKSWTRAEASDFSMAMASQDKQMNLTCTIEDYPYPYFITEEYWRNEYSVSARQGAPYLTHDMGKEDQYGMSQIVYNPVTGEELGKMYMDRWRYVEGKLREWEAAHPCDDSQEWYQQREEYERTADNAFDQNQQALYAIRITYPAIEQVNGNHSRYFLYMPKHITGVFTSSSNQLADVDLTLDYTCADAAGKTFDPEADKLDVTLKFSAGDYSFKNVRVNYLTDQAEAGISLAKGDKNVLTMNVSGTGIVLKRSADEQSWTNSRKEYDDAGNEFTVTQKSTERWNMVVDEDQIEDALPEDGTVEVDVLGKVQVKGTIKAKVFNTLMEQMRNVRYDGAAYKTALTALEETFDLKVFYNGGTAAQARLGLEPNSYKEEWNDNKIAWEAVPVIRFEDGSAYALAEDFFSETNFAGLITQANGWWNEVSAFFESLFSHGKTSSDPTGAPSGRVSVR